MEGYGRASCGFQTSVAERLRLAITKTEKECDKMVVVAVDEMSIRSKGCQSINLSIYITQFMLFAEDIAFRSSTGDIAGYVDFDDECYNTMSKSSSQIATQMLTFFVRGMYVSNFLTMKIWSQDSILGRKRVIRECP